MTLKEQVYAQALLLSGDLEARQEELLKLLCGGVVSSLTTRLREGLRPEDCLADFIAAASLYALAALNSVTDSGSLEQISAGDLTIRKSGSGDAASNCLRNQAELMIAPYLKDRFSFLGV
jgi:hypothetical protein